MKNDTNCDENRIVTLWNQAAERILGYPRDEIIGKSIGIVVPEKYGDSYKKGIERFLKTGTGRLIGKTVELEAKRKDG